jgi:hypothetical protein
MAEKYLPLEVGAGLPDGFFSGPKYQFCTKKKLATLSWNRSFQRAVVLNGRNFEPRNFIYYYFNLICLLIFWANAFIYLFQHTNNAITNESLCCLVNTYYICMFYKRMFGSPFIVLILV